MSNLPAVKTASSVLDRFKNRKSSSAKNAANVDFLSFSGKKGSYQLGREKDDPMGEDFLVNIDMFAHGWALWVDRVCTKVMAPIDQDLPQEMKPKDDKRGRTQHAGEARAFVCQAIDDVGTEAKPIKFETSSMGGVNAVSELIEAVTLKIMGGEETYLYPCIRLGEYSYFNETANDTIYNPTFEILSWHSVDGDKDPKSGAVIEDKTGDEEEPEEDPEEEQPKRQRRKRA